MPDFVPAVVVSQPVEGSRGMLGHAGMMWPLAASPSETSDYQVVECENWRVSCPGCGRFVYALTSGRQAILDGVQDRRVSFDRDSQSLSLNAPVTFVPCGCGTWDLYRSVWKFIAPLGPMD